MSRLEYGAGYLRVAELLATGRTGTCKALALVLDMNHDTVAYHLRRMAAEGLAGSVGSEPVIDITGRHCQSAVVWGAVVPEPPQNLVETALARRSPLETVWAGGES